MHRCDAVGQPDMADRACRGRTGAPLVVTRAGDPQFTTSTLGLDAVIDQLSDELEPIFWGHHPLNGGGGFTQDLDLVLELTDPALRLGQLGGLAGRYPGLQPAVDQIPRLPPIQTGLGDPQRRSNIANRAPSSDKIERSSTELGR